jgi:hypothetical protein
VEATVLEELVEDIVPVPVDVIVTFVPLTTPANDMEELVPVLMRLIAPVEVSPPLPTVIPVPKEDVSVKLTDDGLLVTLLIVVLAVSVMYTAPGVLSEIVAALVFMFVPEVPIVPVPPIKDSVPVVAMLSPAPWVIVLPPVTDRVSPPLAVTVRAVPVPSVMLPPVEASVTASLVP